MKETWRERSGARETQGEADRKFRQAVVDCHLEAARRCGVLLDEETSKKARTTILSSIFGNGEAYRKMVMIISDASGKEQYIKFLEDRIKENLGAQAQENISHSGEAAYDHRNTQKPEPKFKENKALKSPRIPKIQDWLIRGTQGFLDQIGNAEEGLDKVIQEARQSLDENI